MTPNGAKLNSGMITLHCDILSSAPNPRAATQPLLGSPAFFPLVRVYQMAMPLRQPDHSLGYALSALPE